jgi:hypothetical protein
LFPFPRAIFVPGTHKGRRSRDVSRAAVRKAWAIRTGELLDGYPAEGGFWRQAGHGRHEGILAEVVRAERRAGRILRRGWVAFLKLAHALSRRPCGRMSAGQVGRVIGPV